MKVHLSNTELYFLFSLLGSRIGIGFLDPTVGQPIGEIKQMITDSEKQLINRGILYKDGNLTEYYQNIISAFSQANANVLIKIQDLAFNSNELITLAYRGSKIFSLRTMNSLNYELSDEFEIGMLIEKITTLLPNDNNCPFVFPLNEEEITNFRASTKRAEFDKITQRLIEILGDEEKARIASAIFINPNISITLIPFNRKSNFQKGIALIITSNYTWILEPNGGINKCVQVRTISNDEVTKRLRRLLYY